MSCLCELILPGWCAYVAQVFANAPRRRRRYGCFLYRRTTIKLTLVASQRMVREITSSVTPTSAPPMRMVRPTQSNSDQAGTPVTTKLGRKRDARSVMPAADPRAATVAVLTMWTIEPLGWCRKPRAVLPKWWWRPLVADMSETDRSPLTRAKKASTSRRPSALVSRAFRSTFAASSR